MNRTPEFIQHDGSLGKEAREYSCSYKNVEEAKRAILEDLETK